MGIINTSEQTKSPPPKSPLISMKSADISNEADKMLAKAVKRR